MNKLQDFFDLQKKNKMLQAGEIKIHKETIRWAEGVLMSMGFVTLAKKWLKVREE